MHSLESIKTVLDRTEKTKRLMTESAIFEAMNQIKKGRGEEAMLCMVQALSLTVKEEEFVFPDVFKEKISQVIPKESLLEQAVKFTNIKEIETYVPPHVMFEIARISEKQDVMKQLEEDGDSKYFTEMYLESLHGNAEAVSNLFFKLDSFNKHLFSEGFVEWCELAQAHYHKKESK